MATPFFSVVIPTRNRSQYLRYALRTCLDQRFEDYEIVVFDNCSDPSAEAVVSESADARIRYFRSAEPLAMCRSWETALSHACGRYVMVIGDDDGLCVDALPCLKQIIDATRARLVRWTWASYYWPDYDFCPAVQNRLTFPVLGQNAYVFPSRPMLQAVASFRKEYAALPMVYNAAVHRSLIDDVVARTGRFFHSMSPDIGSGIALAYVAGSYLSTEAVLSLAGASGRSNGQSTITGQKDAISEEFYRLCHGGGMRLHPKAPAVRGAGTAAACADSFFAVKEVLFPRDRALDIDRRRLMAVLTGQCRVQTEDDVEKFREALRTSLADDPGLVRWFDRRFWPRHRPAATPAPPVPGVAPGYHRHILSLDGAAFGVTNVYEASQLVENVFQYRSGGFRHRLAPLTLGPWQRLERVAKALLLGDPPLLYR